MIGQNLLTFSRMQSAKTCLKKHFYAYELGIRQERESTPIRIGTQYHLGLRLRGEGKSVDESIDGALAAYEQVPEWADHLEWLEEREIVKQLLSAHFHFYRDDELEIIKTETSFDLPIVNPETNQPSRTFRLAGQIDKIVKLPDGRPAVLEYKTTGDSIGPESDYWPRLRLDTQISIYLYAARQMGYDCQTVIYDVCHKPGMRLLRATPEEKKKFTKEGKLYANLRESDENVNVFGVRLQEDILARRDFYFQRREIPRLESDLLEFQQELWDQGKLIRDCQINKR